MIAPQPKQLKALWILSKLPGLGSLLYGGAKGGGKSWLVRYWHLQRRFKYPGTNSYIFRKTYDELEGNHILPMLAEYPLLNDLYKEGKKTITLPNGSQIFFRHIEHERDAARYQGRDLHDLSIDELTMHSERAIKILRSSQRSSVKGFVPRSLHTTNPGGPGHMYVKRVYIDRAFSEHEKPENYAFLQALAQDNFALMENNPEYLDNLRDLPEAQMKAFLYGDWDVFEGQAFSMWNINKHVIKPRYDLRKIPETHTIRIGWDEGTQAPRSVHILVMDENKNVDVVWEHYRAGQTADEAAYMIKEEWRKLGILELLQGRARLIYDPSMDIKSNQTGRSTSDIVRNILGNANRPFMGEPANNNREEGFRRYQMFLNWQEDGLPAMQIWSTNTEFIRTVPALSYAGSGREDVNTKEEDHTYDDTRYGLMSFNQMPSKFKREPRERILTEVPPQWFLDKHKKPTKKVTVNYSGL